MTASEIVTHPEKYPRGSLSVEQAVVAYHHLEISVGRAAELADVTVREMEAALSDAGVKVRYGPEGLDP